MGDPRMARLTSRSAPTSGEKSSALPSNGVPDPYRAWLNIREVRRPLNAYELLNLPVFESNVAAIRAAAGLQRMALQVHEAEAPPEIWQQIHNELEEAIATLLDPLAKEAYDAALQVEGATRPVPLRSVGVRAAASMHGIVCRECGSANPAGRKFCGNCGKNLWEACYRCHTLAAAGDRFCGACGADLVEGVAREVAAVQKTLHHADQLARQYQFDKAIDLLGPVAEIEHSALRALAAQARKRIEQYRAERQRYQAQADAVPQEADRLLESNQYRQVLELVQSLPAAFRTPAIEQRAAEAKARLEEIERLSGELRQAVGAPFSSALLRTTSRLLALDPQHAHARQVMQRLCGRALQAAQQHAAQRQYEEACRLLKAIPPPFRTPAISALLAKADEARWIVRILSTQTRITPALVALAARYRQIAPEDAQAALWHERLASALQANGTELRPIPTHENRSSPEAGAPCAVQWLTSLPGLQTAPECDGSPLRRHPGQFAVACGLALQGLNETPATANLLPPDEGVWARVERWLPKGTPSTAWGLDLGCGALKAVRLGRTGRNTSPSILAVDLVEHRKPLSQTGSFEEAATVLEETLVRFASRNPVAADRICVSLPRGHCLWRRLEMPTLNPEKMRPALAFEIRSQFPVPLDSLVWDYLVLQPASPLNQARPTRRTAPQPAKAKSLARVEVFVLAAKRPAVTDILARLKATGVRPHVLQSDALALYNYLLWAASKTKNSDASHGRVEPFAAVDLGADGMHILAGSAGSLRLRSAGLGAERMARVLARELGIPLAQAEQLQRDPASAAHPARVLAILDSVFDDYCQELATSLMTLAAEHPGRPPRQIYLLGGGMQVLGLVPRLVAAAAPGYGPSHQADGSDLDPN